MFRVDRPARATRAKGRPDSQPIRDEILNPSVHKSGATRCGVRRHLGPPGGLPSHPNVGSIVFTRDDWSVFQVGDSRQVSVPLASWSLFFGSCGSATARIGSASDVVRGSHGESAVLGGGRYSANPGPKAAVGLLKPSRSVSQHTCP